MDSDLPHDYRHLNLPALRPVNLGETLGPSSCTPASTLFYVQPSSHLPSSAKLLGKRPSTATLAHSAGPLLPAYRHFPASDSNELLREVRTDARTEGHSASIGRPGEGPTGFSNTQRPRHPSIAEPTLSCPVVPQREHPEDECLDWASFVQAYAAGNWDPRHTPNPPRTDDVQSSSPAIWTDALKSPPLLRSTVLTSHNAVITRKRVPGTSSTSSVGSILSLAAPGGGSSDRITGSIGSAVSSVPSIHAPYASLSTAVLRPTMPSMPLKVRREKTQPRTGPATTSRSPSPSLSDLTMPLPSLRGPSGRSLSDSSSSVSPAPLEDTSRIFGQESNHDLHTAAATMRLAGDGINVRPLALPSPEVELTDPLRGHTASLSRSWSREKPSDQGHGVPCSESGGSQRKTRLNGFWEGLGDVAGRSDTGACSPGGTSTGFHGVSLNQGLLQFNLPTISASPPGTPTGEEQEEHGGDVSGPLSTPENLLSTSASLRHGSPTSPPNDYFGRFVVRSPHEVLIPSPLPLPALDRMVAKDQSTENAPDCPLNSPNDYFTALEGSPVSLTSPSGSSRPPVLQRTVSEPIVHTSPEVASPDSSFELETRPKSEILRTSLSRRVREQAEYYQRGYLIPPAPPNERERQRALYKFNIVHTAKDANFDRIALLAKLVFNAKICLISLIDADEQWFKSECKESSWVSSHDRLISMAQVGLGRESSPREESLCGHTILLDHEPLVVLDAIQDWRFEKNPFVTKHPRVRFYAGAPLRTAEGFNIGSLCIIDSEPRKEFGPRQRHTLKEFAAIVMRELELWRDKIQLRIRDRIQTSMEQFTRECLEIDTHAQNGNPRLLLSSVSMEKIYDRAAQLVKRTLDVEGSVLIDISGFEEYDSQHSDGPMSVLLYHSDPKQGPQSRPLTAAGFAQIAQFFKDFPDGKVSELFLPACIRGFMPGNIHYALTVPIFNIDKRPFAMLCAYNINAKSKPYLEGHEMSYLRAIGVIILSAVLKRRMILADKAKSLFISNISHELRTPLHGILAAAELLSSTDLSPNQASFLNTVQACGTSLVETVNHVLDFTKLSGSTKVGGENKIRPARVDLAQLVEEATEGCWIGHRARHSSEIGSVYSPRPDDTGPQTIRLPTHVETVVDISHRSKGWTVVCEKGGIRRCLMNILGNALKFTTDGYVHVTLRQLHPALHSSEDTIKIELGVLDTGKGISEEFLKNHLFQPFSQENPLQPGTGLGLAIVNSIVRSESVGGKIDVWSAEHFGTEIRIIFEAQVASSEHSNLNDLDDWKKGISEPPVISLRGFDQSRGHKLLKQVVTSYLRNWWNFAITTSESQLGDILVLNEDLDYLETLAEQKDCHRPLVFLSSARGDPHIMNAVESYERAGGFVRILFKPIGPSALRQNIRACVCVLGIGLPAQLRASTRNSVSFTGEPTTLSGERFSPRDTIGTPSESNRRRWSQGGEKDPTPISRPRMPERGRTSNLVLSGSPPKPSEGEDISVEQNIFNTVTPTISVGNGGLLLQSSVGSMQFARPMRILVVEDNNILRELLVKWLRTKGYVVREAADGQTGVDIFKSDAFDVVLLDMSMPVLDGVGAATEIRRLEQEQLFQADRSEIPTSDLPPRPSRIVALTGMSSGEDKRRAFEAGVDGYLVKPVSFKTLQSMFKQLGIT